MDNLKKAVTEIHLSPDAKKRLVQCAAKKQQAAPRVSFKKPAVAVLAMVLCLAIAMPVMAAVEPTYQWLYRLSPALAQYFKPVQKVCEDNGIKMEVVSAYIHGDTAEIYLSLQDKTGDRVDETTDLLDSFYIYTPYERSFHCERVGYDAASKTFTFLVVMQQTNDRPLEGDKITFTLPLFASKKAAYDGALIPVSLDNVPEIAYTQNVLLSGGSTDSSSMDVLIPKAQNIAMPDDAFTLTGLGCVDGKLHVQMSILGKGEMDNHGELYLTDADGNDIYGDTYYFTELSNDERTDYVEFVFDLTQDALKTCTLRGYFSVTGAVTKGNWSVTFPLQQQ